jgi:hypothetical protein
VNSLDTSPLPNQFVDLSPKRLRHPPLSLQHQHRSMAPPFLDPEQLNDLATLTPTNAVSSSSDPILILSPSSLSHRPHVLESLLSSLPSSQPHHLQMLDRIALNFVNLPSSHYSEAIFALPSTEEEAGEVENDYRELRAVLPKILETMQPGGKLRIGQAKEDISKDAILAGFLIESQNNEVQISTSKFLI